MATHDIKIENTTSSELGLSPSRLSETDIHDLINTSEEAAAALEIEEKEFVRLKDALFAQQRKIALLRARKEELETEETKDGPPRVSEAAEFLIHNDDDPDDSRSSPAQNNYDEFDAPLESIGVAKCGRCGAKLPLDLEAIDAHTIECERNFMFSLQNGKQGKHGAGVHYYAAVKVSIAEFLTTAIGGSKEEQFRIWLRKFHAEMADDEFLQSSPHFEEGFRTLWAEAWANANKKQASTSSTDGGLRCPQMNQMAPGVMNYKIPA